MSAEWFAPGSVVWVQLPDVEWVACKVLKADFDKKV